jgi:hypothetical protein
MGSQQFGEGKSGLQVVKIEGDYQALAGKVYS